MILHLFIGVILGYVFFAVLSPDHEGRHLERSVRFLIKDHYVHVHHWIYCSLLILLMIFLGYVNSLIIGFLFGGVLQGLQYRDRFVIICSKDNFKTIYSRFIDTPNKLLNWWKL